ncbi:hypothetical protein B2904_orf1971 [Brachyspira pilosicoli B2904]|uniref:Uncharacterized protein n=1 Tax=Brachyspira pilosicoli B2904 TaxID=1133568 RepID=J9UQ95_BRAPL|nr:hypothetical protein [Brachyspira pilosicoli]AFR71300.1 hypothetical protein B2904_orf1971 [Brachyspira pilosicoli B2904]
MNKQLKKELAAIKSNNEEATKEIRKLLNNNNLFADIREYDAAVYIEYYINGKRKRIEIIGANIKDNKTVCNYPIYSTYINDETNEDIMGYYAVLLKLSSKILEKKTIRNKINEILDRYMNKIKYEIDNSKVS